MLRKEIIEIEEEINKMENKIIEFFINTNINYGRDPIKATVLSNFYFRHELTQKQLQTLTGFSAGAISQVLKELVERKIIDEYKPKGRVPYRYILPKMPEFVARTFMGSTELYLKKEKEFQKVWEDIKKFPEELHENSLYIGLNTYFTNFFKVLPVYKLLNEINYENIDEILE
ncbi:MAG: MarR family transcriptional regulator [Candidatus Lokiarchaeota archaeon]|nr:MarR family transcriptional regulator [Candidatus Lokiarchaeota archaeon]